MRASSNAFPALIFVNQSSTPSSPLSGQVRMFWKDGSCYAVDENGAEIFVGPQARILAARVSFGPGELFLTVPDSNVNEDSIIVATVASSGSGLKSVVAVAGAGAFTLYANETPTGETDVNYHIVAPS